MFCKDNANREQNKMNVFIFLCQGAAYLRFFRKDKSLTLIIGHKKGAFFNLCLKSESALLVLRTITICPYRTYINKKRDTSV